MRRIWAAGPASVRPLKAGATTLKRHAGYQIYIGQKNFHSCLIMEIIDIIVSCIRSTYIYIFFKRARGSVSICILCPKFDIVKFILACRRLPLEVQTALISLSTSKTRLTYRPTQCKMSLRRARPLSFLTTSSVHL